MLSNQDREWVKAIASRLAGEVTREVLSQHIAGCPHGKSLGRAKAWLLGVAVGSGAAGAGAGWSLAQLLT